MEIIIQPFQQLGNQIASYFKHIDTPGAIGLIGTSTWAGISAFAADWGLKLLSALVMVIVGYATYINQKASAEYKKELLKQLKDGHPEKDESLED